MYYVLDGNILRPVEGDPPPPATVTEESVHVCDVCGHVNAEGLTMCEVCSNYLDDEDFFTDLPEISVPEAE